MLLCVASGIQSVHSPMLFNLEIEKKSLSKDILIKLANDEFALVKCFYHQLHMAGWLVSLELNKNQCITFII